MFCSCASPPRLNTVFQYGKSQHRCLTARFVSYMPQTLPLFFWELSLKGGPVECSEVTTFIHFQWKQGCCGYCRPQTVVVTVKSVEQVLLQNRQNGQYRLLWFGIIQDCFLCEISTGWPTCWHAVFLLNLSWGLCPLAPLCTQAVCALQRFCVCISTWP